MLKESNYIYEVYRCRSFSKAAEHLFISQPSLSAMVKRVEKEIGMPLFDRSCNPIQLTDAGRFYISHVEKIRQIQTEMEDYFQSLADGETGTLKIGSSSFYCEYSLPILLRAFRQKYPDIEIDLQETTTNQDLYRLLKTGELDLVLTSNHNGLEEMKSAFFRKEYLILAVPGSYAVNSELKDAALSFHDILLGKHRRKDCPAVSLKKFKDYPLVSLREGSDLYERSQVLFRHAGVKPKNVSYLDQMPTAYYLVYYGYGYSIIRDTTVHVVRQPVEGATDIAFYKIDDPMTIRDVCFYYRNSEYLSATMQTFLKYVGEIASAGAY